MRSLRAILMRVAGLFGRARHDRELDAELDSHLQMLIDDYIRAGLTGDEARRRALARFGGINSIKEAYRDRRGLPFLETSLQDIRYAIRTLRHHRVATAAGILVMALAIGANTAVFSVVHAVLLNPLPYDHPDRIVTLTYATNGTSGERARQVSIPDFLDWQMQSRSFETMACYGTSQKPVIAGEVAEYAQVATVTEDFFQVFAAQPAFGRLFTNEEARSGGSGAAIVSHHYARRQFGEPARALGRTLRLLNRTVPIVGVLAPDFDYPVATDVWFPEDALARRATAHRRGNNYLAIARLKPAVAVAEAQAEMTGISDRLAAQYPDTNKNVRVLVTPLQREMVGDVRAMLYLLLGSVAVVLLIACATMATLLLAKATARVPEIAVRTALGAARSRIVRQLLVEASVQAFVAGAVGVVLATGGTRALVALAPQEVPRLDEVAVNGPVLLFSLALCLVVSMLFGLPPALQAARVDVSGPLRQGTGRSAGGRGRRMREGLVIAEIALAVVLVAVGTLLVKTVIALQQAPLGFRPDHVLLMQATAWPRTDDWKDTRAFFEGVLDDVRKVPGVIVAGAMMGPPGRNSSDSGYWIDRMPTQSPLSSAKPAAMNVIAPGTFAALGVPIQRGRDFDTGDIRGRRQVVIINEALAQAAFRDRDPIGRLLFAGFDSMDPMTIVGVVGNIRQYGPAREPQPEVYMPYQQHFFNGATLYFVARTAAEPATLGPSIQRTARQRAPDVSVRVSTLESVLAKHVATPKFRASVLSLFAAVALSLAMTGVYGVMAYVAGQRSKEIGVRMALGANAGSVLWLMLGRALGLTVFGLTAGVLGAIAATRLVSGMLFEVTPHDATTYVGVIVGLGLLSLLAAYWPARRAARIDPLTVLRQE
jgi:putative ABC transport system permease protein